MLLFEKLRELKRDLCKIRAIESRQLKKICMSNNYDEVKEKLEEIINSFYNLPSIDDETNDLGYLGWMIYTFRYMSVYGESYDIKYNAENVLYDMEKQGESNFDLENILISYIQCLDERKETAIKYIIIFILGSLCLVAPFVGVISSLIINLCALVLGTILTYKSLSYVRLSAINSINRNIKILIDKIVDIRTQKVNPELKGYISADDKTITSGKVQKPNENLPHAFKGALIGERSENNSTPKARGRKPSGDSQ